MFLSARATQAEYCDRPDLLPSEVADNYRQLAHFNRTMLVSDVFQRLLARWLGHHNVRRLSILDLGCGDGSISRTIERWAKERGWTWNVTSLDVNFNALRLGESPRRVAASVCHLPFADESFDVVIASQMAHHLSDEQVVQHFREAWRVTRDAVCLTDAHRNLAALGVMWALLHLMRMTPQFRSDGLLSVKRGWRVAEWRELARRAGLPGADIRVCYGSRVILRVRKSPSTAAPRLAKPTAPEMLAS